MTALAGLLDEHGEAIEYDLITLGDNVRLRDLGSDRFTWRDLYVVVRNCKQGSALYAAINGGEEAEWTLANHLLAMIAENTSLNVWMKTQDATRKPPKNRPKPIFRPGVEDDSKKSFGGDKLPISDMLDFLGADYDTLVN